MRAEDIFFDKLKISLENFYNYPKLDNEASRHDRLIFPILTDPIALGWNTNDIWAQQSILIPDELKSEYTFSGGVPKSKRPDIVIKPYEVFDKTATIIEEKAKQKTIENLSNYSPQLIDYLSLYKCTWGILSDGEKWIIKKGFEDYLVIPTLEELQKNLKEFKQILSKESMIERYYYSKSFDLIYFRPYVDLISKYAINMINNRIPEKRSEINKIIENISLLNLAFLDANFLYKFKLPHVDDYAWTYDIEWYGPLYFIIEIVILLSWEERCNSISLQRYTPEKQRKMNEIWPTWATSPQPKQTKEFKERIVSLYDYNTKKYGPGMSLSFISECYENRVKFFRNSGA